VNSVLVMLASLIILSLLLGSLVSGFSIRSETATAALVLSLLLWADPFGRRGEIG